jgi:hypothetical protein
MRAFTHGAERKAWEGRKRKGLAKWEAVFPVLGFVIPDMVYRESILFFPC